MKVPSRSAGVLLCWLTVVFATQVSLGSAHAAEAFRILFVGGDWKAQLPNYRGDTPLRGHFVRREVERAAPGRFEFTLWTSYEFLQYGDAASLAQFDAIVVGDVMGQSVLPRLVEGLRSFVAGGGGLLYCDNHKAFSFNTKELSFDAVLPIEVVPFRPYDVDASQPICKEKPLKVTIAAVDHPAVRGLDWASAPPLAAARFGRVKEGATVLARSPAGKDIWVAWSHGQGRAMWLGGVLANDELSEEFAKWPQFGMFYAQVLNWLSENSRRQHSTLSSAVDEGSVSIDLTQPGSVVTAAHFGIHGQEDSPGGSHPMQGADLAMYQALKLDGTLARTGIGSPGDYVKRGAGGQYDYLDDGEDITRFDAAKYDFQRSDIVLADVKRIGARPLLLAWCPWWGPSWPEPRRYTKYFAAALAHANGDPTAAGYQPRVGLFEIMNEPNLEPADTTLPRYAAFFNHASSTLRKRFPGVEFGCGGFYEWSYFQRIIDACGGNLDWLSRHPYGHTGEAVFYLQDQYAAYAKSKGLDKLKFLITEWDFWIYGEPAFDYLMMRWQPLLARADTCLATLHYRWREYQEGGYVFGVHGEFDQRYGELPPEWPNPGKDRPITYRYNAFWLMRDCRGQQFVTRLEAPALTESPSTHAYAVASCDGKKFNVVVYYGYPVESARQNKIYDTLKLRLSCKIPAAVQGRTLVVSRADARRSLEEPAQTISGDELDLDFVVPAKSGVSITVQ